MNCPACDQALSPIAAGGVQTLVQVVRDLGDAGIPLDDVALRRPTLDDVFLTLTGHAAEQPEDTGEQDQEPVLASGRSA